MRPRARPVQAVALAVIVALARPAVAADPPAGQVTRPPRLVTFVEAETRPDALAPGATAIVVLSLEIGADGRVASATVARSAGPAFDDAAIAAAKRFVFEPALVDGKPAPVRITYRYTFTSKATPVRAEPVVNLEGTVLDAGTGAPLAGATVALDDLGLRATTDVDGRFAFTDVPIGPHPIAIAAPGRLTLRTGEVVSAGKRTRVVYRLVDIAPSRAASVDEEEVVRAPRARHEAVEIAIDAAVARRVAGTQGDTLKVVQNLPGVARPAFGAGQLVVWGAAPGDTHVYVDGVEVPALYHQGGLRGVVISDLVQSIQLLPGAFGPQYGRGLGGVVEVATRPLPLEGVHGFVAADFLDASAMVSAGLGPKLRAGVAVRTSYVDRLLDAVAPDVERFVPTPHWRDAYGEVAVRLRKDEEVRLVYLGAGDEQTRRLDASDPAEARSDTTSLDFHRVYVQYRRVFEDGASVEITPYFGRDDSRLTERFGALPTHLDVGAYRYGLRATSRWRAAKPLTLTAGVDFAGTASHVDRFGSITIPPREGDVFVFGQPPGDDVAADAYDTHIADLAPFVSADLELGPLTISPGVRFDAYLIQGSRATPRIGDTPEVGFSRATQTLEPRVAIRLRPEPRVVWTLAAGIHHQPPAPEELGPVFGTPALTLQRAIEISLGARFALTRTLSFDATGFVKHLDDLVVRSRIEPPILARSLVQDGEGRVAGLQLLARQELWHGFLGWISYAITRSERRYIVDPSWRLFDYDQPHLLTVVASQELGPWTAGARFRYASGLPRTPVVASYYDARDDRYDPLFGPQNSIRLPPFYALDLRVERAIKWRRFGLDVYLDVLNATFHQNPEEIVYDYRYRRPAYITGLPTLAVLGAKVTFSRAAAMGALGPLAAIAAIAAVALGCAPELGAPPSHVGDERVLAVAADFPEVPLGAPVTYSVLVASSHGTKPADGARWAFCHAPKPLAENNVVPEACLHGEVLRAGRGPTVTAPTPTDACALFGSDLPPGESGLRPRDPDATGGYYQPVRVEVDGLVAFGLERIVCNLANAPADLASKWLKAYRANQNPTIAALHPTARGKEVAFDRLPRGAEVTLRVSWPASSKEDYAWFDAEHLAVRTRHEAMEASWFATAGSFAEDRTGRAEDDDAPFTEVAWTSPERSGEATLWVVLRDSRGGVDWIEQAVAVE